MHSGHTSLMRGAPATEARDMTCYFSFRDRAARQKRAGTDRRCRLHPREEARVLSRQATPEEADPRARNGRWWRPARAAGEVAGNRSAESTKSGPESPSSLDIVRIVLTVARRRGWGPRFARGVCRTLNGGKSFSVAGSHRT